MKPEEDSIIAALAGQPIVEYAFLEPEQIPFSERVRAICRKECSRYGQSRFCPPAVGTLEECRSRCLLYKRAFFFSTVWEEVNTEDMDSMLYSGVLHERIAAKVAAYFQGTFGECLLLSREPCMEGYGIQVINLSEACKLSTSQGPGTVTWFGMILY